MTPQLTPGELRALRQAARQTHRTPKSERVERHPQTRQYARALFDTGLLGMCSVNGRPETLELSVAGLDVLSAYWRGVVRSGPRVGPIPRVDVPPAGG